MRPFGGLVGHPHLAAYAHALPCPISALLCQGVCLQMWLSSSCRPPVLVPREPRVFSIIRVAAYVLGLGAKFVEVDWAGRPLTCKPQLLTYGFIFSGRHSTIREYCRLRVPLRRPNRRVPAHGMPLRKWLGHLQRCRAVQRTAISTISAQQLGCA